MVDYRIGSARLMSGSWGFDEQDVAAVGSGFDRTGHSEGAAGKPPRQHVRVHRLPARWRERLADITAPTLVVHGDEDPLFPHGTGMALAAEIPCATLLTLPGIGQGVPRVT